VLRCCAAMPYNRDTPKVVVTRRGFEPGHVADQDIQIGTDRLVTRISCGNSRIGSSEAQFSRVFNVTVLCVAVVVVIGRGGRAWSWVRCVIVVEMLCVNAAGGHTLRLETYTL